MNKIEEIIKRGYGSVTINSLISLTYHDGVLTARFEALPGMEGPSYHLLASRTAAEILYEIHDLLYQDIIFYFEVIASDLVNM
jgi:hypothetical protein